MIKHALLLSAIICTPYVSATENFFYLGAKGGLETLRAKPTQLVSYNTSGLSESIAGVYAGYRVPFSSAFSAAVEIDTMSHNHLLEYTGNAVNYEAELGNTKALGIILKHHYTPLVDFNLRYSVISSEVSFNPESDTKDVTKEDLTGYQLGIGFDLMNQTQMSFRVEYVYSNYGDTALYPNPSATDSADKTELRGSSIVIGAHYRF